MLDYAALYTHCLQYPGSSHDFPFGPEVAVFRVAGKMFALCNPQQVPLKINLKCEPVLAELLREKYQAVAPGWHMNKRHWNTITVGEDLNDAEVLAQVDQSYVLVTASLPQKTQRSLGLLPPLR